MSGFLRVDAGRRSSVTAASLVLAAWLALSVWSLSPYAEWLDHARIEAIAAPPTVRLVVFTLGWTLMIIAMMLPATLLLLACCLEDKPLSIRRLAPVILAYLAVWAVFGSVSYLGDSALHEIVERVPALEGVIAPGVLLLAGVYQFTSIKRACLSRCRPEGAAFKTLRQSSRRSLWTMGLLHGVFSLGSCWALMLLMFAIGGVSMIWMLVLGAVMAAECLSQRGEGIARLLGVVLVAASALLLMV